MSRESLTASIPTVNIENVYRSKSTRIEIHEACKEWGFFQVTGHNVDLEFMKIALQAIQTFFSLPQAEKNAIARSQFNPWGFYDKELTKNQRDWKQIFDFGPENTTTFEKAKAQWPKTIPNFEATMHFLFESLASVAMNLIKVVSLNLGLKDSALPNYFDTTQTSFQRLNYYPTCGNPNENLGINPHTDAGALTVLLHDSQKGLEILRQGNWYSVVPKKDTLLINIGDIVQVWSNDEYQAPVHRVITNRKKTRLSAPFFLNPSYKTNYAPLKGVPRYTPINWGEFRKKRSAGDYEDLGKEIQIRDYRIECLEQKSG
tara:strand:- start:405 stop:1352 length:948 start_codon:yes stop_codon:yes gene_type:complete